MANIDIIPTEGTPPKRATTVVLDAVDATPSFKLKVDKTTYKHQYANIYYYRLTILRRAVEEEAKARWANISGGPVYVDRVLDILKGQICWILGTVYVDMPLKPNVLEDIARDHSIPAPPSAPKYCSPQDAILLEDESGRVKLVGEKIKEAHLVTGVVVGVLGMETPDGDFEVVDFCFPGMAPMIEEPDEDSDMEVEGVSPEDEWIAAVSGLDIGAETSSSLAVQMMIEYLSGEEGGIEDRKFAAQISRLIIVGNSIAPLPSSTEPFLEEEGSKKTRGKYGAEPSTFSPHPTTILAGHLQDIGSAMPIHILPGENDPSGVILPQQPFPRAMMGPVASLPSFYCETNPAFIRVGTVGQKPLSRCILAHAGQPLNDIFKYISTPPTTSRLSMLESTLKWRHIAPTAPDTLWCLPYNGQDPFLLAGSPDIFLSGGQKKFGSKLVKEGAKSCRVVLVPEFSSTGTMVLVNLRTLDVRTRTFRAHTSGSSIPHSVKMEID
ncbi:hypothetical protein CYLTODRAFT_366735 [Cylindrobasidium torrendii FP15055 ss-10]|uniref:DNA-directed DNA polymerase n=1 Tax=Cylindrobasidium torrendii FP15055 ss-10 TaxID=1314674 RepID=A0A0D7BR99_9AGAR|nr:hypothetical protein CYLTODRAFT_366735 [Cylindrobasidium torrendii FP15055 ss-10]